VHVDSLINGLVDSVISANLINPSAPLYDDSLNIISEIYENLRHFLAFSLRKNDANVFQIIRITLKRAKCAKVHVPEIQAMIIIKMNTRYQDE